VYKENQQPLEIDLNKLIFTVGNEHAVLFASDVAALM